MITVRSLVIISLIALGCATTTEREHLAPLRTVEKVDVTRYLGTWYEIASYPQSFQRDCFGSTAHYDLRSDGEIDVTNRCRKGSLQGPEDVAKGLARVQDSATNAKLEVSFFRPFWGKYWIIDLGPQYEYAVVGHPGRDYLWILSRTRHMDDRTYAEILSRLQLQQYDVTRLRRTEQSAG